MKKTHTVPKGFLLKSLIAFAFLFSFAGQVFSATPGPGLYTFAGATDNSDGTYTSTDGFFLISGNDGYTTNGVDGVKADQYGSYIDDDAASSSGTSYIEVSVVGGGSFTLTTSVIGDYDASSATTTNDFTNVHAVGLFNGSPVVSTSAHSSVGTYETNYGFDFSSFSGITIDAIRAYYTWSSGTTKQTGFNFESITIASASAISPPALTTTGISAITSSTASSGGNVTSNGGAAVTARGICWSTSQFPTTSDSFTSESGTTGAFTSNLTSLSAGTLYYVRAYATNSVGTAYGNEVSFTTLSATSTTTPTFTATPTSTPTFTASPTFSPTVTGTSTATPEFTQTVTLTPTMTYTATTTPTTTSTFTATPTTTPTSTITLTATPTMTTTLTASPTASPTSTITSTVTPTSTSTSTITSTYTATPTVTSTFTETVTSTPSVTFTATPTATPTSTITSTYTVTETSTPTFTATVTPTTSATGTPSFTVTPTVTITLTNTPTPTVTLTATASTTSTFTPTVTPTSTASATTTPTSTITVTSTVTLTSTTVTTVLEQGAYYPSPARGDTIQIWCHVQGQGNVGIKVYNVTGELVATLNETCNGNGSVPFDIRDLSSGFYYYLLDVHDETGKHKTEIKKLVIVK